MSKRKGKAHKPSEKAKRIVTGILVGGSQENRGQWDDWNIRMRTAIALAKGGQKGITTDPIERD